MNSSRKCLAILCFLSIAGLSLSASVPCDLRPTKYGLVCACNATYCDFLDNPKPTQDNEIVAVSSSKAGLRFEITRGSFLQPIKTTKVNQQATLQIVDSQFIEADRESRDNVRRVQLSINRTVQHQKIVGFGGSLTGAVNYLMDKLPTNLQDNIYKSYYADDGIAFNLMRISIGGCDFDLAPWAYNEYPVDDMKLTNFTLDPRDQQRIAQIKRLIQVSGRKNLRIKAAAWSSPPWMKSNNDWTGFSHLRRKYYQTWADYHLKWLQLMEDNGLSIWAISTGNEPLNGVINMVFVKFMSLGWIPSNQAIWLADHLGPTIRSSKFKDIVIFNNDDQRYSLPWWFTTMNETRSNVLDYVDGVAVHWYWDEMIEVSFIDRAHEMMPNRIFLNSESCIGDKPWQKDAPLLGSWERGEKYARDFLQDLQHGFHAWIDWNIILDEEGGPNYVDNTVDAPVIVNTETFKEVYKQPMFYTMGHFAKFVPENSIRIESLHSNVNIDSVAFLRPDGTIATIVYNSGKAPVEIQLDDSVQGSAVITVPPRSIHTLLYK